MGSEHEHLFVGVATHIFPLGTLRWASQISSFFLVWKEQGAVEPLLSPLKIAPLLSLPSSGPQGTSRQCV